MTRPGPGASIGLVASATTIDREDVIGMTTVTPDVRDEVVASSPEALREQALERLKKRRDLHAHMIVYLLVNLAIWGVWLVVASHSHSWWPWPIFLTLFWGIGLAMNAWDVYFRRPITEAELRREIEHLGPPD